MVGYLVKGLVTMFMLGEELVKEITYFSRGLVYLDKVLGNVGFGSLLRRS